MISKFVVFAFFFLSLANFIIVLSPLLESAFVWDDVFLSTTLGAVREFKGSFGLFLYKQVGLTLQSQLRFYPLGLLSLIPFYFFDLLGTRIFVFGLVLMNLFLYLECIRLFTRSLFWPMIVLIVAPCCFQFRFGCDAILGFGGIVQWMFLFFEISVLFFLRYLGFQKSDQSTENKKYLVLSVLFYIFSILTYEAAYPFFVIYFFIAAFYPKPSFSTRQQRRKVWSSFLPFLVATGAVSVLVCGLQYYAKWKWKVGINLSYQPSFAVVPYLKTLVKHCVAAMPGSFAGLARFRTNELYDLRETLQFARGPKFFYCLYLVISQSFLVFSAIFIAKKQQRVFNTRTFLVFVWGALLWALPGVLIASSPKYQQAGWISWGYSYIPVYVSFFGVLSLLSFGFVQLLIRTTQGNKQLKRVALGVVGSLFFSCFSILHFVSNEKVVLSLNEWFKYNRNIAEASMKRGLFAEIPGGSYLMVNSGDFPAPLSAFYRTHVDTQFRKVTSPGHFLGSPIIAINDLYLGSNKLNLPLPSHALRESDGQVNRYEFEPSDQVYYFSYEGKREGDGHAILGRLKTLVASERQILEAKADLTRLYLQTSNRKQTSQRRQKGLNSPNELNDERGQFIIANGANAQVRMADRVKGDGEWGIFQWQSSETNPELTDLLTIKVE